MIFLLIVAAALSGGGNESPDASPCLKFVEEGTYVAPNALAITFIEEGSYTPPSASGCS